MTKRDPEKWLFPGGENIVRASFILAVSRTGVFVLALTQYMLLARMFGITDVVDAYLVAQSIPAVLVTAIEATVPIIFIPLFVKHLQATQTEAWKLFNSLYWPSTLFLALLCLLLAATASILISLAAPGLQGEAHQLAVMLTRILVIQLPLIFSSTVVSCAYYSMRRYLRPGISALFPSVFAVGALILFAPWHGISSLAVGFVLGCVLQNVVLLVGLMKEGRLRISFDVTHPANWQVWRLGLPRLAAVSLFSLSLIVDRFFASLLGGGYISALAYAERMIRLPYGFVLGSVGRAMLPEAAELRSKNKKEELQGLLAGVLRSVLIVMVPVMGILMVLAGDVLRLVFGEGPAPARSAEMTEAAFRYYGLGLLFYAYVPVLRNVFFVFEDALTPLKIAGAVFLLNVIFDWILYRPLLHRGIALATSLVAGIEMILLWVYLRRRMRLDPQDHFLAGLETVCAGAGMVSLMVLVRQNGMFVSLEPLQLVVVLAGFGIASYAAILLALRGAGGLYRRIV